jgi:hypothetical protein
MQRAAWLRPSRRRLASAIGGYHMGSRASYVRAAAFQLLVGRASALPPRPQRRWWRPAVVRLSSDNASFSLSLGTTSPPVAEEAVAAASEAVSQTGDNAVSSDNPPGGDAAPVAPPPAGDWRGLLDDVAAYADEDASRESPLQPWELELRGLAAEEWTDRVSHAAAKKEFLVEEADLEGGACHRLRMLLPSP